MKMFLVHIVINGVNVTPIDRNTGCMPTFNSWDDALNAGKQVISDYYKSHGLNPEKDYIPCEIAITND